MCYKAFIQNKYVDISTQRINTFLSITNTGDVGFHLEQYSILIENLLIELIDSPNPDLNSKQLYIFGEFTHFYRVLNKMVCANLLPFKHSYEIDYIHAKILNCIGKRIALNVGIII